MNAHSPFEGGCCGEGWEDGLGEDLEPLGALGVGEGDVWGIGFGEEGDSPAAAVDEDIGIGAALGFSSPWHGGAGLPGVSTQRR